MTNEQLNLLSKENLSSERLVEIEKELQEVTNKVEEMYENMNLTYSEVKPFIQKQEYLKELVKRINKFNVAVGDGVTVCYWSDREAYTVIKRTKTTITIQRDKATLSESFKPEWAEGGFAGHCINQNEQSYTYEADEKGSIKTAHWSKKDGCFKISGCKIFNGREEFYDYNF